MLRWRTYDGETVTLDEIDHQHFSNVYWFQKIINNRDMKQNSEFVKTLAERFDGEILPYRPPISFKYEMSKLIEGNHIQRDPDDPLTVNIVYKGEVVGHIIK
jgi:hypothetical protein